MNHLPPPLDGRIVKIPWFSRLKVFHPDDFFKIPGQYHVDHERLDQNDIDSVDRLVEDGLRQDMPLDRAQAFLQEWLWFSLLSCITGQTIDSARFYDRDDHSVNTKVILNNILDEWIKQEKAATPNTSANGNCVYPQPQSLRASLALECAQKFILKHLSYEPRDSDGYWMATPSDSQQRDGWDHQVFRQIDPRLTLSIAVLGQILQRERKGVSTSVHPSHQLEELSHWGSSVYCREKMMESRWCPSEIRRVETTMAGPCEVYYASFFQRPGADTEDHTTCTIWQCNNASQKEPPSAMHMIDCPDGKCRPVILEDHERTLERILQQKLTPLATFTTHNGLDIKGYDLINEPVQFGALSHSWGDAVVDAGRDARGRNDRTMLKCQISQLQGDLNDVLGTGRSENFPFWVDVLCLPRQETSKRLALEQMHNTYQKASAVIVWDKALLGRPKEDEDNAIEMNVRIRLGDWSRRLWTCLEAVLAKEIWVRFKNGLLNMSDIVKKRNEARDDLFHRYHHIWEAGSPLSKPLLKLRNLHRQDPDMLTSPARNPQTKPKQSPILRAWLAVQFRDVEMIQDEPVVLASLLGLNVEKITRIGHPNDNHKVVAARRMAKLLDDIDTTTGLGIPAGIIFLPPPYLIMNEVPGLHGYGWAPMTWLSKQVHSFPLYPSLSNTAKLGKHGLFVTFPALELHIVDKRWRPQTTRFWVPVKRNLTVWYKIQLQRARETSEQFWAEEVCSDAEETSQHPCIILSNDDPQGFNDIGLLVKRKGQLCDGRVRVVEILCRVKVRQEQNSDTVGRLIDTFRQNRQQFISGECTDKQEWCVFGRRNGHASL